MIDTAAFETECFFIAPIGESGSAVRDRSDGVTAYIVTPAASDVGLTTVRADMIAKPGEITRQVIEHVIRARAAVVDLTGANPNVYYEMAIRHTAQLPTVLIAEEGERLPFDIVQMRTIFFDHTSLKSAARCREEIVSHLTEALDGAVASPVTTSVSLQSLEQGTAQDRILAELAEGLEEVRVRLVGIDENWRRAAQVSAGRIQATPEDEALLELIEALHTAPSARTRRRLVSALPTAAQRRFYVGADMVSQAARYAATSSGELYPESGTDSRPAAAGQAMPAERGLTSPGDEPHDRVQEPRGRQWSGVDSPQ